MTKGAKQYNGAKVVFTTNGAGITGHPHAKNKNKKTQEKDLILFTKINSNRSDLHVKCKTIRLLKDNRGENLDELEYANGF